MSRRSTAAGDRRWAERARKHTKRVRNAESRMVRYYARQVRTTVITIVGLIIVGAALAIWWFYLGGSLAISP